ncbi:MULTISPECIES: response regulator transcription factor [Acidithrix]|uniref:Sensory transduction protein regX3 n=1 Tax=Acidithrix ferrooxidans TaxID=1280514 RepID=A0A0D8HIZ7_9ACTN|nr:MULTISPECIES: response regulator transcription factor [Acidithrix]KJF17066.1 sensory transduction protein regX3 [Acidithrix ferrooxidans]CAG4923113.1 unnamed protein product [Acidithrix sp. C25]
MTNSQNVLTIAIIEDDPDIADLLNSYLRKEGYRALIAGDAHSARQLIETASPSLILLDLGLPGGVDGLELLKEIRGKSQVPIMVVTARDGEIDRILGLELGADDYVAKPFSPREVIARIKAILRRTDTSTPAPTPQMEAGNIKIDTFAHRVTCSGIEVALTTKEFELLRYLVLNRKIALNRDQILEAVWGVEWFGDERTIDVHIRQLRKKFKDELNLVTLWGVGYRLE